ncbi:M55 family metallopeptidase [Lipingzhangella sp. LS1_29]|uniref:M55 family metallopeptidase n=1 Tax=Lipingzhangella rawalii TaxID=2055835 RepID=A0ABU2H2M1_9ACTN|nr:M55 family metallopeptidase [Lipingzhangella rawalii]MDS1269543.1 M55 family metallopeptidase [Lipingzhangella rawalii]
MRILISADMEGATGTTWPADVEPGTPEWQRCRPMFTSDVNAAIAGLHEGGADEILVNEAHSTMRNLLLEELDSRATMLTGRHKDLTMVEGIQSADVAGVVFLGYHAGAGAEGVLAHTYLPNSITGVWLDGAPASEGRLNAAVAAEYGVPVLMVTGDDRACADAASYAPHAATVAVKDCVSRYAAVCRPPATTAASIRKTAAGAMDGAGRLTPRSTGPHTVEIELDATHLAATVAMIPTVERTSERRIRYTAPTAHEMVRCFKVVTTLAATAMEHRFG